MNNWVASPYPPAMNDLQSLSSAQLHRAADLKEQIEKLENELASLLSDNSAATPKRGPGRPRKLPLFGAVEVPDRKRRKMSATARDKIAAAAKARWAKTKKAGKTSL